MCWLRVLSRVLVRLIRSMLVLIRFMWNNCWVLIIRLLMLLLEGMKYLVLMVFS